MFVRRYTYSPKISVDKEDKIDKEKQEPQAHNKLKARSSVKHFPQKIFGLNWQHRVDLENSDVDTTLTLDENVDAREPIIICWFNCHNLTSTRKS